MHHLPHIQPNRQREQRTRKQPRIIKMLDRTNWRCGYCACQLTRQSATRDHIVPRARHGKTCDENLIICCLDCNQRKADLDVEDFRELYFGGGPFWHEVVESAT